MSELKPYLVDVPVLVLFFNRPEPLRREFEIIRQARPSRLLLYQDGPRNDNDLAAMEACRRVVEQVDWQCEVHRNYQTVNAGCDPSNYNAQRWAFSLCDRCVVLEDDDLPSLSFFTFCREMLERYEHDERVMMITGFNHEEITADAPADYLFARTCTIWGWASWRRAFNTWDADYRFVDDPDEWARFKSLVKKHHLHKDYIYMTQRHKQTGVPYYESIAFAAMVLHDGLCIVPAKNLINNLGPLAGDSVHYGDQLATLPRGYRRLFTMRRHELSFPLKHPAQVVEDEAFRERVYRIMAWDHPWIKVGRSLEELWLNLRHGNLRHIGRMMWHRVLKTLKMDKRH